jgi:hypothetical protein
MPVVKQWKLKERDKLDWEWKVQAVDRLLKVDSRRSLAAEDK